MLCASAPLKATSEALGHTTVGITADLYTDVLGGLQRETAEKLGATFAIAIDEHRRKPAASDSQPAMAAKT